VNTPAKTSVTSAVLSEQWRTNSRPGHGKQVAEASLKRLKVDAIDLSISIASISRCEKSD